MTGRTNENFPMGNVTPLVWILPASCDLIGTTMLFIGLSWTYASSFQMLRGSVIIFTGVFSVIFLKAKLRLHHYLGIILVVSGLVSIGIGDFYYHDYNQAKSSSKKGVVFSDLLIVFSQVITAFQMIIEEKVSHSSLTSCRVGRLAWICNGLFHLHPNVYDTLASTNSTQSKV